MTGFSLQKFYIHSVRVSSMKWLFSRPPFPMPNYRGLSGGRFLNLLIKLFTLKAMDPLNCFITRCFGVFLMYFESKGTINNVSFFLLHGAL